MRGSSHPARIDAGGIELLRENLLAPSLFRVHDRLSWLNANWAGATERIAGSLDRKPHAARPLNVLGAVMASLLAASGIVTIQSHGKPTAERQMSNLGQRFAQIMKIDCGRPIGPRFPDHQPACR